MLNKLAKHHNYWLKILSNLGADEYLANELVQQMYLKLHDKKGIEFGDNDVNKYYVYRTLYSLYIQYYKDLRKDNTVEYKYYHETEQSDYNEERDYTEDLLLDKVRDIVNGLSSYDKELFQVYFGVRLNKDSLNITEGKSMREISEGTDISTGSIFYSIKQIKRLFRDNLKEDLQDFYNEDYDRVKHS
jgi:hypothetical protein